MITKSLMIRCWNHLQVQGAGRCSSRWKSASTCLSNRKIDGFGPAPSETMASTQRRVSICAQNELTSGFVRQRTFVRASENGGCDDACRQFHTDKIESSQKSFQERQACRNVMWPHLRSCLSNNRGEDVKEKYQRDTGFTVSFLGTGGGMPTTRRNTSATLLRLGGLSFLFDAGEGLQRQIGFTRVHIGQISKIFITHLHGDHLFGLPGLLLMLRLSAKAPARPNGGAHVVEIYGPPGLYNYIAASLALSCSNFRELTVVVHELVGGQAESGPRGRPAQQSSNRNIFRDWYPELSNRWIVRKSIERNEDGTWTLHSPESVSEDAIKSADKLLPNNALMSNDVNSGSRRQLHIAAAEVTHLPGIQTFGFVVEEPEPPGRIDPQKAKKLGVLPGPKYKLLKNGFPVMSDDGTREVQPESVLLDASSKARKFALIGDNCAISPAMAHLCRGADVLVHEATMLEGNASEAIIRGHASAETAGRLAKSVNAKVLVLNHISPGLSAESDVNELVERTEWTNVGVSQVVVAHDFMELVVPRLGFDFEHANEEEESSIQDATTNTM